MKRLLILEGNTRARQREATEYGVRTASGIYSDVLNLHFDDIHIDIVHGVEGSEGMPANSSLDDYDGLVIGGSGLHCADATPEVTQQVELVRQFAKTGRPILGSCWGLQIAVIAAGGTVRPSPNGREIVIARKIRLTAAGREHPLFYGKPDVFDAPCIHYDEIDTLPKGATLLCSNAHSEVQGALVPLEKSLVWAVQYHPEFDMQHLGGLLRLYSDASIRDGFFQDMDAQTAYIEKLAKTPNDKSAAWQLGIDRDLLDKEVRAAEIINWVRAEILTPGH
jgi:GMP synthase (glutamine-hydrolysing)